MEQELPRIRLGLTQERLAWWLGVTREVVAQVEIGRRSLPVAAGMQDIRLQLATIGLVPAPAGDTEPLAAPPPLSAPPVEPRTLTQRLHSCRLQCQRLLVELEAMRRKAAQYELRLKVVPALRAWTGPVPPTVNAERWLDNIEGEALDGLRDECGLTSQRLLTARLAGLEREAELLEQMLAEPES